MIFSGLLLTLDNVQALNMSWMKKQNRKSMRKCIKGSINFVKTMHQAKNYFHTKTSKTCVLYK